MTVNEAQGLVKAWRERHFVNGDRGELISALIERLNELVAAIGETDSSNDTPEFSKLKLKSDFSDICWLYMSLASDLEINMENSLLKALTVMGVDLKS